jgi:hypothetical protein
MKRVFITILILICFTGLIKAQSNNLIVYQNGKAIGSFTVEQFQLLVDGADKYKEIMLAQKEDRVSIQLLSDLEKTHVINQYKAVLKIQWLNEKNEEINYVSSIMFINIDNQEELNIPKWRILYRDISEIGFPICGSFLILFLILLL